MKPNFNLIKSQIQPESAVVDDTIRKANAIENAEKPMPSRKNFALVAGLCVFILCIISIPYLRNELFHWFYVVNIGVLNL